MVPHPYAIYNNPNTHISEVRCLSLFTITKLPWIIDTVQLRCQNSLNPAYGYCTTTNYNNRTNDITMEKTKRTKNKSMKIHAQEWLNWQIWLRLTYLPAAYLLKMISILNGQVNIKMLVFILLRNFKSFKERFDIKCELDVRQCRTRR